MLLGSSRLASIARFLTWKPQATAQGRLYFQLVPSALCTKDSASSLLPTPTASDATGGDVRKEIYFTRNGTPRGLSNNGISGSIGLARYVRLWPTPKASDAKGSGPLGSKSQIHDQKHGNLKGVVMDISGGQLNPTWTDWLMGFPLGWTDLDA